MAKIDMTDEALNVANQLETFALAHGGGRPIKDAARLLKEMQGKAKVAEDMKKSYRDLTVFVKKTCGCGLKDVCKYSELRTATRFGQTKITPKVSKFSDSERMRFNSLVRNAESYCGFCCGW